MIMITLENASDLSAIALIKELKEEFEERVECVVYEEIGLTRRALFFIFFKGRVNSYELLSLIFDILFEQSKEDDFIYKIEFFQENHLKLK